MAAIVAETAQGYKNIDDRLNYTTESKLIQGKIKEE